MDVELLSSDLSYEELLEAFGNQKFSRMPVYTDRVGNIVGTINLKDLFFFHGSPETFNIMDLVREPYITYEYRKTSELFVDMRKDYVSLGNYMDEYG